MKQVQATIDRLTLERDLVLDLLSICDNQDLKTILNQQLHDIATEIIRWHCFVSTPMTKGA